MKKILYSLLFLLIMPGAYCQIETFDIVRFTPPKNFKKDTKKEAVIFSEVNQKAGIFCLIALYASTASLGDPEKDFNDKWKELILSRYQADANPKTEIATAAEDWKTITGAALVKQDSIEFYVLLTVFSGFGKVFTVMANLNDQSYIPLIDELLHNMKLDKSAQISNAVAPTDDQQAVDVNSIIGTWSDQSVSIANYVSPSGSFIGSADISTMEEYEFKSNKTYLCKFFGSMNGKMYYTETSGTYSISGNKLSLFPKKRRGGFGGSIRDEKDLLDKPATLDWYIGPNKWDAGPYLNLHQDGKYYMWSDFPYSYYKKIKEVKVQSKNPPAKDNNIP